MLLIYLYNISNKIKIFLLDLIPAFENIEDVQRKLYFAAANIQQKVEIKQKILEEKTIKDQYFTLSTILSNEIHLLKLEDEIDNKVQESVSKTQRKYYIQEQIRALQKELGDDEVLAPELIALQESLEKANLPEAVKTKAAEEFERLKKTPSMSPEFSVNRTYLELIASLPWTQLTQDNLNINHVKNILDEDHFDLEKPKERILEYIAILNFTKTLKRQILCFVGPPGVGKTSLAKSIARALGRKFIRFSLGGIRDEAEIRGHRRTYIGALPGKIIQSMKKAESINPVILLDEIDKMSMDFRGDPSSALLEVLDPEQNVAFNDHYLEVDYDLSNVLFITTANVRFDIPLPLQDRMEIIELNSYLENDKLEIAKRHIIPKLIKEYGLDKIDIKFHDDSIYKIIREYTREAGVRNLEREISSVLRKIAKEIIENYISKKSKEAKKIVEITDSLYNNDDFIDYIHNKTFDFSPDDIERLLKAPRFKHKQEDLGDKIGVVNGLAWTSVGGEIMPIEVSINPGPEKLTLTGKLGDVMKESAIAALTNVKANTKLFDIPEGFYKKHEIHIHVPEGAIPKDGPSAGITMTIAIISAASGKPVRGDVAMTGEITLRGNILPIGGLNEKLLAAQKAGMTTVLVPFDNARDIEDIKPEIIKRNGNHSGLNIFPKLYLLYLINRILIKRSKKMPLKRINKFSTLFIIGFLISYNFGFADIGMKLKTPKNVIIMISDGCGFNHIQATDLYQNGKLESQSYEHFPIRYFMSTYPAECEKPNGELPFSTNTAYNTFENWTNFFWKYQNPTCSGAAATAMATGVKTFNGAIGMNIDRKKVLNLSEFAKKLKNQPVLLLLYLGLMQLLPVS